MSTRNSYLPNLATVENITVETWDIKTFRIVFDDEQVKEKFDYKPGQFAMLSAFGVGECPISITSSPTRRGFLEFSIKKMGKVTDALHKLEPGAAIGVRGPYGNWFPVEDWHTQNLIFIGGGIGQAPLRSVIQYVLDSSNRRNYGTIDVIYGARSQKDLVFKNELFALGKRDDINTHLSIDVAEAAWHEFVGFVPDNLLAVNPNPKNAIAVTCGPPIMIKFVIQNLLKLGFDERAIYTTLEMRMKCGLGSCGRCNIGKVYVCKDGPVFTYEQIEKLPAEF